MPIPSTLPESPTKLLEEWRGREAPLCVKFGSQFTRLQIILGRIFKVTENQVAIETDHTVFWLNTDRAKFKMPDHAPTALTHFGEGYADQFVRVLFIHYTEEENCLIFEWIAQPETEAVS